MKEIYYDEYGNPTDLMLKEQKQAGRLTDIMMKRIKTVGFEKISKTKTKVSILVDNNFRVSSNAHVMAMAVEDVVLTVSERMWNEFTEYDDGWFIRRDGIHIFGYVKSGRGLTFPDPNDEK